MFTRKSFKLKLIHKSFPTTCGLSVELLKRFKSTIKENARNPYYWARMTSSDDIQLYIVFAWLTQLYNDLEMEIDLGPG